MDEVEPEAPTWGEVVVGGFSGLEAESIDEGVLLDGGGVVAAVGGDEESLGLAGDGGVRGPVGVGWLESALAGLDPDLQEVGGFGGGGVEFRVGDAGAGAHELDLSWDQGAGVAERVLVGEASGEDVGEDFHVPVGVGGEAAAWGDMVVIDDAERAEAHVGRVVVIGEGEGVTAFEPAVAGEAAFV